MYIQLMHRHYGVHEPVKHMELPCTFDEVYHGNDIIDEDRLLELIPDDWLPVTPSKILLVAVDDSGCGTGQYNVEHFMVWAKYFDAYVLEIFDKPLDWWSK